jgi:hypothetical protein
VNPPRSNPLGHPRWIALVLLLLLDGLVASAESVPAAETVIVLQPRTTSPAIRRSLARIRDELSADRFHVILADLGTASDPAAVIETAGRDQGGDTVLALFGDPATGQAELCVVRRAVRHAAVRQATVAVEDPERMPEALAMRALELLRATALELSIAVENVPLTEGTPERVLEVAVPPSPLTSAAEASILSVDMGLGLWNSIEGPPPAVTPVGRLGLRLSERTLARVSVVGLGSRPRVQSAYGSATLSQNMAVLEFVAVPSRTNRIRPTLSLGAGVLYVAVDGTGTAPYEGRAPQQWTAAFDGGVGVAFALGSHLALVTELHALLASPRPVVRFVDTRVATVGYPSLLLTLALQVSP